MSLVKINGGIYIDPGSVVQVYTKTGSSDKFIVELSTGRTLEGTGGMEWFVAAIDAHYASDAQAASLSNLLEISKKTATAFAEANITILALSDRLKLLEAELASVKEYAARPI